MILMAAWLFPIFLFAQEKKHETFLFENFEKGIAMYTNGKQVFSFFNYDVRNGKILFMNDDVLMELANPDVVSYIRIDNRFFVHIKGDTFYERIPAGNSNLFVNWKYQFLSKGKDAAYGVSSHATSATSVSIIEEYSISYSGNFHEMKSNEKFSIVNKSKYYVSINGKFKNFNSAKSFIKLFKQNEKEISEYIKIEKIDFNDFDDLIKVVSFASQFVSMDN